MSLYLIYVLLVLDLIALAFCLWRKFRKPPVVKPGFTENDIRLFDKANPNWCADSDLNLAFLKGQEIYFNNLLDLREYVFLSDVYRALGFNETPGSRIKGWIKDEDQKRVDFGIERNDDSLVLEFNHDGIILNRI